MSIHAVVRTVLLVVVLASGLLAQQRMGLISGSSVSISAGGSGELPSRCMDEHAGPPTIDTRYTKILHGQSEDVIIELDGKQISLDKAVDDGLVSISGVTDPRLSRRARIDNLRINNLTDKSIRISVKQGVVLGTSKHRPFDYDASQLLDRSIGQKNLWQRQVLAEQALQSRAALEAAARSGDKSALESIEREDAKRLSTDEVCLFRVVRRESGFQIVFGGDEAITISESDLQELDAHRPLPTSHPVSAALDRRASQSLVSYASELRKDAADEIKDKERVLFGLQASYPDRRIYKDPFSDRTTRTAKLLSTFTVSSSDDFVTLIAEDSFDVTDWSIVRNVEPALRGRGFKNIQTIKKGEIRTWGGGGNHGVMLITGHTDEHLDAFVEVVGKAGYFSNNYVIMNACNEEGTAAMVSRVTSEFGAIGVFYYEGTISADKVETLMVQLADAVSSRVQVNLVRMMRGLLTRCGLNGIWMISMMSPHAPVARSSILAA